MSRYALTHVNVITGDREGTVSKDHAVIIDGTSIVDVVPRQPTARGDRNNRPDGALRAAWPYQRPRPLILGRQTFALNLCPRSH